MHLDDAPFGDDRLDMGPGRAEAESADLIVVGSRALAREDRLLLGSVSDYVVNNSTCPVLIAR